MNFIEFLSTHCLSQNAPDDLRYGQWLMNQLSFIDQKAFVEIAHTDGDCFYKDENIPRFWERLYQYHMNVNN